MPPSLPEMNTHSNRTSDDPVIRFGRQNRLCSRIGYDRARFDSGRQVSSPELFSDRNRQKGRYADRSLFPERIP